MARMISRFQSQPLEKVLAMNFGDGKSSYSHNSLLVQIKMVQAVIPILERAIHENTRSELLIGGGGGGVFRVADFRCGTGRNTLLVADTIVKAVQRIYTCNADSIHETDRIPEFEVYFSDLPSNDFNSLFRTLPPLGSSETEANSDADIDSPLATRSYFAAAVSGSHFRRLFPRQTLHFCHSSQSLQWLSQVPESVEDKSSAAWNGSRIYVSSDSNEAVGAAYLHQFDQDLTAFLRARAEEMIPGGCILLSLVGRNGNHIMREQGILGDIARHFEYAFEELVIEGLIENEIWESFNMPWFGANPEELESIVQREKSFVIKSVQVLGGFPLHPMAQVREGEEEMFGVVVEKHYRALFENVVGAHLRSERLTDEFFRRIGKGAASKFGE